MPEFRLKPKTGVIFFLGLLTIISLSGRSFGSDLPYRILCLQKTPVIDGIISSNEWPEENQVRLSRAFHNEQGIYLYFAYDSSFLYLGAYVEDGDLWADGNGGGAGDYWEHYNDDSIEWYFDPNNSGDNHLMSDDRFLALNIGNFTDPLNGTGIVSRRSFNRGTGDGGAEGVDYPGIMPSGLTYMVHHFGTVNNSSDTDTGYSIEVRVPWSAILRSPAVEGDQIGITVTVISDDTGGVRDWSDNRNIEPPALRFTTPIRPDEYVELKSSPQHSSQSGLNGPSNYAVMQFHQANDTTLPGAISLLTASSVRPYSVKLNWPTTGDNGTQGDPAGFEIRYSTSAINEGNFSSANPWPARILPPWSGGTASTRVMGLSADTNYYFAVRAYDEAGNLGPVTSTGPVRTSTLSAAGISIPEANYKGAVQVSPAGRYFMTENGANFIPVGHHFLLQDSATRYLYTGSVWTGSTLHDFSSDPDAAQKVTDYLDQLEANGVTAMRIFLEDFSLNVNGNFNESNGAYWLEFPRNTYNQKMGQLLVDLLQKCSERGIYLLINPFDTFYYDDYFDRTAWSQANGGPLSNINEFFTSQEALEMCKARWFWIINVVKNSGYADALMGYEILNEWDSKEWTEADSDPNTDAATRVDFITELAQYVRSLDDEHLLVTNNTSLDPRGALGAFVYYSDLFDASLPHLYFPGNREPWNNPFTYQDTAVEKEQSRAIAWWTINQLNRKPVLDGEWGPSDGWMPDPANPSYFEQFQEEDDELITKTLWFTELASGGAGPGIRMQGGVRAFDYGLFLSDAMMGTEKTLSNFVENGSTNPTFDFTDFNSENLGSKVWVSNTSAKILATGCSDGYKGLVYLMQDRNTTTMPTVSGATLNIGGLKTSATEPWAEFWRTDPDQTGPAQFVQGQVISGTVTFAIPDFSLDWAVRFFTEGEPNAASRKVMPGVFLLLLGDD